jgi:uncharacterized Fe-S cluster-containing radical SAM superfamily protein
LAIRRVINMLDSPSPKPASIDPRKFRDPDTTGKGEKRATVALGRLATLWFNTGTLCNITCANCYIESSPKNDRLAYLTAAEVTEYLDEIAALGLGTEEIGFTGGEPFMNPDFIAMLKAALERNFRVLLLTNAMKPMQHRRADLIALREQFGDSLAIRVSLDHYTQIRHESERGPNTWKPTMDGLRWLAENGFDPRIAGRTYWGESESELRQGYARLFAGLNLAIDTSDTAALVLFPEMDASVDVPEITEHCWGILGVDPANMMCASSRMVVKRKDAPRPAVVACTLLPYAPEFELGARLADSLAPVKLNHPHCAKFCVLGGGSCSVPS